MALTGGLTLEPCNPHGLLGTSGEDDDGPSSAPGYHSEPQANRWVGKGEAPSVQPLAPKYLCSMRDFSCLTVKIQRFLKIHNSGERVSGNSS